MLAWDRVCLPKGMRGLAFVIFFFSTWLSLADKFGDSSPVGFGPHRFFWKAIWNLKTLPNIRVFSYRVGHGILPTYGKISSIHQDFKKECHRCCARAETLIHALKYCRTTRTILAPSSLDNRLLGGEYSCFIDWIEDVIRVLDMKAVIHFIMTIWNSWNNCNNFVFRGKEDDACKSRL
ncbi:hypothetical protein PVK06_002518 [Gossypium arboreum]|uniref:Reverse transcriptase zinc-binding domain-containing protein n=1 Tax=Gossypium arboreum TaxID=29729 RepID=A0ABR0R3Z1_GOSAR|nr:hypothetical protein PVK06_002518 [Gossypium arboreum]